MINKIKSKIRNWVIQVSGRIDHLKVTAKVPKKWYGNEYGGFFVCPTILRNTSVVYSFGIGEDVSFDESIISKHKCSVFGFDPTPKSIDWIESRKTRLPKEFAFFKYGISNKSGPVEFYLPKNTHHVSGSFIHHPSVDDNRAIVVEMRSLADIVHELGHKRIDVLKMDIEGAEYQTIESILASKIEIDQVLVEFHERFFPDGREKTMNILAMLEKGGFQIFGVSDSFEEISFIHKRILDKINNKT
jgi:FkbM family methyltransferase